MQDLSICWEGILVHYFVLCLCFIYALKYGIASCSWQYQLHSEHLLERDILVIVVEVVAGSLYMVWLLSTDSLIMGSSKSLLIVLESLYSLLTGSP